MSGLSPEAEPLAVAGVRIQPRAPGAWERLAEQVSSPLIARVLAARGVRSVEELELELGSLLTPAGLVGLDAAVDRLYRALLHGERILLVGDFDADGATSVSLAVSVLNALGAAHVDFLVPNRFDFGYGLTPELVEVAAQTRPQLIVTVDNGISSLAGVDRASALGIDVVITDHHLPGPQLPAAHAIVNPQLCVDRFGSGALAGVGVIYYVMVALRSRLRSEGWFEAKAARSEPRLADWLDLVALGTVADVVPLDRNNRILVHQGLRRMRAGRMRPGLRALCEVAGRATSTLSASDLGFALGPRLNAAGRLDDMTIGIRCLLAEDLEEARSLAIALDQLNRSRREIEADMTREAEMIVAGMQLSGDERAGLAVYDANWHSGVVGIVAGRLRERFHRPVIAFADGGGDEIKGSARSIPALHIRDLLERLATRHPGLIRKFGGHAMAAGLTLKRLHYERFARAFDAEVRASVTPAALAALVETDGALSASELTLANAQAIERFGPWGQAFPEPLFHGDFELVNQRVVGGEHLRLVVRRRDTGAECLADAIAFRTEPLVNGTEQVRLVYRLGVNRYRDAETLQLGVEHLQALP